MHLDRRSNSGLVRSDVLAPGVNITSASIENGANGYVERTGTSPATAFVSGMIALYLDYDESLANDTDGDGYPDIKQHEDHCYPVFQITLTGKVLVDGRTCKDDGAEGEIRAPCSF